MFISFSRIYKEYALFQLDAKYQQDLGCCLDRHGIPRTVRYGAHGAVGTVHRAQTRPDTPFEDKKAEKSTWNSVSRPQFEKKSCQRRGVLTSMVDTAYSSMEKRGAAYVPSVAEYGKKRRKTRNIGYAAGCICGLGMAAWMVYVTLMVNKGTAQPRPSINQTSAQFYVTKKCLPLRIT